MPDTKHPPPIRDIAEAVSDDDDTPRSSEWDAAHESPAKEPKGVPLSPPARRGKAVESKRGQQ